MPTKKKDEKPKKSAEPTFSKAQIIGMKRYSERQDLLSVLLDEEKQYSHSEVISVIDEFMKVKKG